MTHRPAPPSPGGPPPSSSAPAEEPVGWLFFSKDGSRHYAADRFPDEWLATEGEHFPVYRHARAPSSSRSPSSQSAAEKDAEWNRRYMESKDAPLCPKCGGTGVQPSARTGGER